MHACDGVVGGLDYGIFGAAWGSKRGDDNWDSRCDFNQNSLIDGIDYGILAANWGNTYPDQ